MPARARAALVTLLIVSVPAAARTQPPDVGWANYGGSYANTRRSELTQINTRNVASLKLAWSFATGVYGQFESSPVVVGDALYFTTGLTNMVIALDAATGALRWRFAPKVGPAPYIMQVNRGVAVSGERVFFATLDDRLIALDARNGTPLWDVHVGDPRAGMTETMAPLAWNGMVFIGSSGGEYGIRGSFSAYAQSDGRLLWRWWSVSAGWEGRYARAVNGYSLRRDIPRERAAAARYRNAWQHGGGPIWMTPALDPSDGTIYLSSGNPAPVYNGDLRPGDNLYTDAIVALDARSGRMRWYYQETPHDRWDYDAASPPLLFDALDAQGRRIPAVGEAGKTGWLYVLDRRNGALLRLSQPFIPQTHLYAAPTAHGSVVQPGEGGGAIGPVAYDPALRSVFVAGTVAQELLRQEAAPPWPGGSTEWHAGSQDWLGRANALVSRIDVDSGRIRWQHRAPSPVVGGLLSAGDLVFAGEEGTGALDAFDARSGTLLWQTVPWTTATADTSLRARLSRAWTTVARVVARTWSRVRGETLTDVSDQDIHAPPIAYEVGGVEYVVIAADLAYSTLHPNGGDTLYAFALPATADERR